MAIAIYFTRILRDLQWRYPQGMENAERVSVAWLYIRHEAKRTLLSPLRSTSMYEVPTVDLVLRTLAYEIARNDPLYRKDHYASYKRSLGDTDDVTGCSGACSSIIHGVEPSFFSSSMAWMSWAKFRQVFSSRCLTRCTCRKIGLRWRCFFPGEHL
jgi:hypothetical protein